jgi:Leucine-rich repeat (LRR) protein
MNRAGHSTFPKSTFSSLGITELQLAFNTITTIPKDISLLQDLKILALNNNRITSVPEELGELTALTALFLETNNLTSIPKNIGKLGSIKILNLSKNQIEQIPNTVGNLILLITLNLEDNRLLFLPDSIGELINLTTFDLSGNQLSTLPDSMISMQSLRTLDLSQNNFTTLPDSLASLTKLSNLDISSNNLHSFPDWLENLVGLTNLIVSKNYRTEIENTTKTSYTSLNPDVPESLIAENPHKQDTTPSNDNSSPFLEDLITILQQEKIKNVIRLPPEKIPTRYSSLLRLRLRQETNKIDSEIKQYLNSYNPSKEMTIETYQSSKKTLHSLPILFENFQKYQPSIQTLDGLIELPISDEFIEFQSKWISSICEYRERLGVRGLRKLRRISLPITQKDVIRFTKLTKRHKPEVPFSGIMEGFIVGVIVVAFFLFVLSYLS